MSYHTAFSALFTLSGEAIDWEGFQYSPDVVTEIVSDIYAGKLYSCFTVDSLYHEVDGVWRELTGLAGKLGSQSVV